MFREIEINLLIPHQENSNFMPEETLLKIRRHIERTGKYEPLTVRPHPVEKDKFQIINGHHRFKILKAIGHKTVKCVVWEIDDDQCRLYLATLNRLAGEDVPERRAALIENLLGSFDVEELAALLPDDRKQIEELERLAKIDRNELEEINPTFKGDLRMPVTLNFMMEETEAKEVNLALDLIIRSEETHISRSQSLVRLAHFYLERCTQSLDADNPNLISRTELETTR